MVLNAHLRRWHVLGTVGILVLSIISSLLGLFREGHYDVDPALLSRFHAQDAVILVVAVPVLAIGLWTANRGSVRGRVVWLGGLAYMTYMWASIVGTTPFGYFFLGYVVLFSLSLFTLVAGVATTDPAPYFRALDGHLSKPLYAGFLLAVALGLSLLWLSDLVPALLAGTRPVVVEELGEQAIYTYILDLGIVVPSLVITAAWIWQGRQWGYVFAGVLLVMAALLAPSLTAITVVDALGGYVTLTTPLIVGTILPPVVAVGFAIHYLRILG